MGNNEGGHGYERERVAASRGKKRWRCFSGATIFFESTDRCGHQVSVERAKMKNFLFTVIFEISRVSLMGGGGFFCEKQ